MTTATASDLSKISAYVPIENPFAVEFTLNADSPVTDMPAIVPIEKWIITGDSRPDIDLSTIMDDQGRIKIPLSGIYTIDTQAYMGATGGKILVYVDGTTAALTSVNGTSSLASTSWTGRLRGGDLVCVAFGSGNIDTSLYATDGSFGNTSINLTLVSRY